MARQSTKGLTEREAEIMEVLWDCKACTSEEIRLRLSGNPHDSSVRTLLRILVQKGYAKADSDKRPTQYRAAVRQEKVQKNAVEQLVQRLFGGSAETLVLRLLEDKQLSVEQLEELREAAKKATRKRKGDKS